MNLEALSLKRAQEQMDNGAWRTERDEPPRPEPADPLETIPLLNWDRPSGKVCLHCRCKALSVRNRSNLCRDCHFTLNPERRARYRTVEAA